MSGNQVTLNVMAYQAVVYNNREEALAAYKKMVARKRKWVEETMKEFAQLRKSAL